MSVLTSVLLTQPLQVILIGFFFVVIFRKYDETADFEYDHDDNGQPINNDQSWMNTNGVIKNNL